jgi:hypothetical protein
MIRDITVTISASSLWGATSPDEAGYDAAASEAEYATKLFLALGVRYPCADVTVELTDDMQPTKIDIDANDDERDEINLVVSTLATSIFESGAWIAMQADD